MTHYDTLEVSQKASLETIKAAYKSLMQRYHPDRNPGDPVAADLALRINNAYSVLFDPEARASYDSMLATGRAKQFATDTKSAASPQRKSGPPPVKQSPHSAWSGFRYMLKAIAATTGLFIVFLVVVGAINGTIEKSKQEEIRAQEASAAAAKRTAMRRVAATARQSKVIKDCDDCPEMLEIPAGKFERGSTSEANNQKPAHTVNISNAFALAETEVTQGQWRAVMGNNPSNFLYCGADCPVENVSWDDAQEFVRKLSQKTGKAYRLPSEAEWEYACRAGGIHTYCGSDDIDNVAWYEGNGGGMSHPVASKQANAWGLYDMSGNAWEWTQDCWNDSYAGGPLDGSAWQSGNCTRRVMRGGSWKWISKGSVAGIRFHSDPSGRNFGVGVGSFGFRPARTLP